MDADSVLVLRGCGPGATRACRRSSNLPLPPKLLEQGVRDMVRICDGRMSGTAYGTVVLHVAPEAAAGGPLALVQTGDVIVLDVARPRAGPRRPRLRAGAAHPEPGATTDGFASPRRGWGAAVRGPRAAGRHRRGPRLPGRDRAARTSAATRTERTHVTDQLRDQLGRFGIWRGAHQVTAKMAAEIRAGQRLRRALARQARPAVTWPRWIELLDGTSTLTVGTSIM